MASVVWGQELAEVYDVVNAAESDPSVLDPMLDVLADLARNGDALEFAVGTGRVALGLAARGVRVHGVELSPAMAEQLRRKSGAQAVPVTVADMTTARVEGRFALVYLVANHVGVETFDDAVGQVAWSHHWMQVDGRTVRHAAPYRYVWPAELDLMARLAGLRLRDRWAGWDRAPFTAESPSQVAVFTAPDG